jgi:Protein of unknown function (DUF1592)/Protein of unknown function (DUF1588)/Protein of unknown function (DUF1585)
MEHLHEQLRSVFTRRVQLPDVPRHEQSTFQTLRRGEARKHMSLRQGGGFMRWLISFLLVSCTGAVGAPGSSLGQPSSPTPSVWPQQPACQAPAARLRKLTPAQLEATIESALGVDDGVTFRKNGWLPYAFRASELRGMVGQLAAVSPAATGFTHEGNVPSHSSLYLEVYSALSAKLVSQALANPTALHRCATPQFESSCVENILKTTGEKLFRRPLTTEELTTFMADFENRIGTDTRSAALSWVLRRMTLNPATLFRFEIPQRGGQLNDFQVAEWLSFTLADKPPSETLRAQAAAGKMHEPDDVKRAAEALLASAESAPAVERFTSEWLPYEAAWQRRGDEKTTDKAQIESRTEQSARELVHAFFGPDQEATVQSLFEGTSGWVNADMARWYGLAPVASGWARVELPVARRGFLQRPAFLAARKGTTARALAIRRHLLCSPVPETPEGVNTDLDGVEMEIEKKEGRQLSPREIRSKHMSGSCAECHAKIDPLGFPFDVYDAEGTLRSTIDGFAIDTSGGIVGTASSDGAVSDAKGLAQRLARSDDVKDCIADTVFEFVNAEPPQATDSCALQEWRSRLRASNGNLKKLWLDAVTDPRWLQRVQSEAPHASP